MSSVRGSGAAIPAILAWGALGGCAHGSEQMASSEPPSRAVAASAPIPGAGSGVPARLVPPVDERALDVSWREIAVEAANRPRNVEASASVRGLSIWSFRHADAAAGKSTEAPAREPFVDLESTLRRLLPTDIDRVFLFDTRAALVDLTLPGRPQLWIDGLEISVENLATRRWLQEGRPILLAAQGMVQGSGALTVFVSANPWAEGLTFAGRASIVGLRLAELQPFIMGAADLAASGGTIDLYLEFSVENGQLVGGIKPIVRNAELAAAGPGVWDGLKAILADAGIELLSRESGGDEILATVVPISGRLTDPKARLWPALLGVLRNAFIEGIAAGFGRIPPPAGG